MVPVAGFRVLVSGARWWWRRGRRGARCASVAALVAAKGGAPRGEGVAARVEGRVAEVRREIVREVERPGVVGGHGAGRLGIEGDVGVREMRCAVAAGFVGRADVHVDCAGAGREGTGVAGAGGVDVRGGCRGRFNRCRSDQPGAGCRDEGAGGRNARLPGDRAGSVETQEVAPTSARRLRD